MRVFLTTVAVLLAAGPVWAQAPAGPEFLLRSASGYDIFNVSVAAHGTDRFVVVWDNATGVPMSVRGRQLTPSGSPIGAEFIVSDNAYRPRVAPTASDGFAVAYSRTQSGSSDVFVRRFGASGPAGGEVRVNTSTTGYQLEPAIAGDGTGALVVAWSMPAPLPDSTRIAARRFDAAGDPVGLELVVSPESAALRRSPAVAMAEGGAFMVAWVSPADLLGELAAIVGQRFAADGTRVGEEFQISAFTTSFVSGPALAALPGGGFVAAWDDLSGAPAQVKARRYEGSGAPAGPELVVASHGPLGRFVPTLAAEASGRFVLAWFDDSGEAKSVVARRFDTNGAARGRAFAVAATNGSGYGPAAAFGSVSGDLALVWTQFQGQSARFDLHGQAFRPLTPRAGAADPSAGPASDGNGVLEAGETVELRPRWQNHSGSALALDGRLASITGPPGAAYTMPDAAGSYGTVPDQATRECVDCFQVGVSAVSARPVLHWDAMVTEELDDDAHGHEAWPLHIGDSFGDVPRSSPFYRFAETLLHTGVSGGCGGSSFCGGAAVTRGQMAVMVLEARDGPGYTPFLCGTQPGPRLFSDVPASDPSCTFVEELARRGVTTGCGSGRYCPEDPVRRDQVAVFLLRTLDPALSPPACTTPRFADVPASSAFCRWVEELARRGITAGCGGGNYCPAQPVTREQMAVFLTTTFGLTLYGP